MSGEKLSRMQGECSFSARFEAIFLERFEAVSEGKKGEEIQEEKKPLRGMQLVKNHRDFS